MPSNRLAALGSRLATRRAVGVTLGLLAVALLATACEIEKVGIPRSQPLVAMHAVLSASAATQVVLLERTRSGSVAAFDLGDPVISAPLAESDAIVELTLPDGRKLTAIEDKSLPDSRGQGVGIYRFTLPGDSLDRSGAFRLSVRTAGSEVLTAETSVPGGIAAAAPEQRVFDRSRDTLVLDWPASPGARSYLVRIESPFAPRAFFTDSTRVRLAGGLRNIDAVAIPRVFTPGFPQTVTVSAVDSNYYDWYRTHNNRLSGAGLVNRVSGGIGVFGSLVRLRFLELDVMASQTEPAAGTFRFEGTQFDRSVTPYLTLQLYVESHAARADQADALSGRYDKRVFLGMRGCVTCGLLGTARDGRIELAFLTDWSARDTTDVLTGEFRGDTIVGRYRVNGMNVRFVRQP